MALLLCKMSVLEIFGIGDFFRLKKKCILRSTKILAKPNFWLGMYVPYILKRSSHDTRNKQLVCQFSYSRLVSSSSLSITEKSYTNMERKKKEKVTKLDFQSRWSSCDFNLCLYAVWYYILYPWVALNFFDLRCKPIEILE